MLEKCVLLASLLLPFTAGAVDGGAWSRHNAGGSVSTGNQVLVGRALQAPQRTPQAARITRLSWKITLLSPPPPGLQIQLCRRAYCLHLPALSGQLAPEHRLSPDGDFRFIYRVNKPGQLRPPLNVVSNQLTVSYR